jgi:hypothetical protein
VSSWSSCALRRLVNLSTNKSAQRTVVGSHGRGGFVGALSIRPQLVSLVLVWINCFCGYTAVDVHVVAARVAAPAASDRRRDREQPGYGCQAGGPHRDAHPTQTGLLDR